MSLKTQAAALIKGEKHICRDLNLHLKPGEIWGVLGRNGSGKTSLLQALAGLDSFSAGSVYLHQTNITQLSRQAVAQRLGILLQHFPANFHQTVWDYAAAGRFPHRAYFSPLSSVERAQIETTFSLLELNHLTQRLITNLSGGEKKRLALASLFIQAPSIYLLDEPFNELDLHHQMTVLTHIERLATQESATIMMSLHDVNMAKRFCHFILMLFDDGEIAMGETKEMLNEENLSRLYHHPMQFSQTGFWLPK